MRHIPKFLIATFLRLKEQPRNAVAIGILISIVTLGLSSNRFPVSPVAVADSQHMVSVYADGQKKLFSTNAATVGDALKRAGVKVEAADLVEPVASTVIPDGQFNINVYRARSVMVTDGERQYHLRSAYQSPRRIAQAAGLTVYPEDNYRTEVVTDFVASDTIGENVIIDRAIPFSVKVDGKVRNLRTQEETVGDALKDAHIALGLEDAVSQPLNAPLLAGTTTAITRVSEAVATLTQTVPRTVTTIEDPTVLKGQTAVKSEGSDGQKTMTYRINYRDGVETSREALQVVSETAPVAKVIVKGTKVFFAGSVEYWRPQVEAAAADLNLDPNMMLRIMACESGGNATSVSKFTVNGEHPTGLFQYLPSTWRSAGGSDSDILDGATQIKLTAKKMAAQGTSAWECR